jgi:CO/xanthine dehydrogenase FAD-binding subunit
MEGRHDKRFRYLQPATVKEALAMHKEHRDDYKVICGGQLLLIIKRQGLVTPNI